MNRALETLASQFPLPEGWVTSPPFFEELRLGDLRMEMIGLSSRGSEGAFVVGSAAQSSGSPLLRAYFELLERVNVWEEERYPRRAYVLLDKDRNRVGECFREDVFPKSDEPENWVYSKSNGIAAHTEWDNAVASAAFELMERDRILRSWYGIAGTRKCVVALDSQALDETSKLGQYYSLDFYEFQDTHVSTETVTVAGVFGFGHTAGAPTVYGFAARRSLEEAIRGALSECLQRLAFLWGEEIPSLRPVFSATAQYHQEIFLMPDGLRQLRNWLRGDHPRSSYAGPPSLTMDSIRYFDLTPPHLVGKVFVVKAVSPNAFPLTFGYCKRFAGPLFPENLLIHPIA